MDGHHLHRRKSSKDEDENIVLIARPMELEPPPDEVPLISPAPPPRNRVRSTPNHHQHQHTRSISSVGMGGPAALPSSPSPLRAGFNLQHSPSSPFRSSFAPPDPSHTRTRSISAFAPSIHSPLASSFPPTPPLYAFPSPSLPPPDASLPQSQPLTKPPSRRHARLHSRNLSVFFPRPGSSLPQSSIISEDGSQELEIHGVVDEEAVPISTIPSPGPRISLPGSSSSSSSSFRGGGGGAAGPPTPLGAGFTFGARPPTSSGAQGPTPELMTRAETPTGSTRRGHHHKHSMSHTFFSFLEPGAAANMNANVNTNVNANANTNVNGAAKNEGLHTQPTPVPLSPWAPISAFPQSAGGGSFPPHTPVTANGAHPHQQHQRQYDDSESDDVTMPHHQHQQQHQQKPGVVAVGLIQFILGAWLWVCGQQIGSLSVTGLGYWVVFDAFGVGLAGVLVLSGWVELTLKTGGVVDGKEGRRVRRPYGNAPVQTVLMFAQAVYLMFSSVYVCKETVEHLLLSAGGGEGHHHHHGDEDEGLVGIEFPVILAFVTLVTVLGTSVLYNNHSKLLSITGIRIPSLPTLIRTLSARSPPSSSSSSSSSSRSKIYDPPPTSTLGIVLSNPYVASPLVFASAILVVALFVPLEHHRTADLLLAALITTVTFNLAYRACTILGTVLLQTAPPRGGGAGGRMEAFLRAMREVERHPQVLHLPAPHIWQLTPTPALNVVLTTNPNANASVNAYTKAYTNGNANNANGSSAHGSKAAYGESLVVTLELHVRHDLGDGDVLALTRWVWEKCAGALGGGGRGGSEITVGVVRG